MELRVTTRVRVVVTLARQVVAQLVTVIVLEVAKRHVKTIVADADKAVLVVVVLVVVLGARQVVRILVRGDARPVAILAVKQQV